MGGRPSICGATDIVQKDTHEGPDACSRSDLFRKQRGLNYVGSRRRYGGENMPRELD